MNYQIKRVLTTAGIAAFIILCCLVIGIDIGRTNTAMGIAQSRGCEYIGSARDLTSVKFFDCNGKIEMIRVK